LGLLERFSNLFKAKANKAVDALEKPDEMLDYSFEKQNELMVKLRQGVVQVVSAKKQLEIQKAKLEASMSALDEQARKAVKSNRDDLARSALERKNTLSAEAQKLDKQIAEMQAEQGRLEDTERRLSAKVQEFKTKKEVIKAQYTSAEAAVKIKEGVTGISEEMSDIGVALGRAEEKTDKLRAKSQALDEMIDSGTLTDVTSPISSTSAGADIEAELDKTAINQSVEEELAKMKAESQREVSY
jgi:phage shock protein A